MTVEWYGADTQRLVEEAVFRGVVNGVYLIQQEATRMIQSGAKSGRIYRRRGIEHQASAPGEAPASDTGNLAQNTDTEFNRGRIEGIAIWRAAYAPYLEFGTSRMEPRPFARPAAMTKREEIIKEIASEIVEALKGAGGK